MMNELKRLMEIIEKGDRFFLLSHIDPDGDAIGSLIALSVLLGRKGKLAVPYDRDGVPEIFSFVRHAEDIVSVVPSSGEFDVAVFLECPNLQRAGEECQGLVKKIPLWVNLDHHVENANYGHLNIVDAERCAIAEIIYDLYDAMYEPIDRDVAEALYVAIMTDTGSYKYSNTTPRSHEISARLIEVGVNPSDTYQRIYENLSRPAALIAARAHSTLEIDGQISCVTITRAMLDEVGATPEDTQDIVNFARPIENVEVALLFRETDNGIKVSLRSKSRVNVNKIAAGFKGGGHLRAAGCTIEGGMERARELIYSAVRKALEESENHDE